MSTRPLLLPIAAAALMLGGCQRNDAAATPGNELAAAFGGGAGTWVDLTWPFSDSTIYWPTDTLGFRHDTVAFGPTPGGYFYSSFRYSANEHGGTHLDAPIHFADGKDAADQIPLSSLMGPAVVVDVSAKANADYLATIEDLMAWETEHGRIPDHAIVLLRTGWGDRYGDRAAYLGTSANGADAVPLLHFPALSPEAAQWLVNDRKVKAFGLDTPSVDRGQSTDFRTHVILYSANVPGFENVAHLEQLPATGSYVMALPMKIKGGSGGPLRIIAYVP